MSIRKKIFLVSFASFLVAVMLIFLINALAIAEGVPLLVFVAMIILFFVLSWITFLGALRYRPSADTVADDLLSSIITIFG